uniref:Uncharacterized protein n=1 Tax=viral metagenome TaxID=1070528 RepID=A0A6C0JQZ0_9ZZZZ
MTEDLDMAIMLMQEKIKEAGDEAVKYTKLRSRLRKAQVQLLNESLGIDIEKTIKDYFQFVRLTSVSYSRDDFNIRISYIRSDTNSYMPTCTRYIKQEYVDKCIPSPTVLKIYDALGFIRPKIESTVFNTRPSE